MDFPGLEKVFFLNAMIKATLLRKIYSDIKLVEIVPAILQSLEPIFGDQKSITNVVQAFVP